MTEKIPTTVITGFLGSGKTTLIRNLIENANGRRLALIVNEFGDVGIDGEMLKACGNPDCTEDDILELANGCICCTVAEDFVPTMEKILERDERPDHIIIETSGLALPQPLVRAFNWPEIKTQVTVDGVVTLVDAAAMSEGRFASDEAAVETQRKADEMLDHETPLGELFEDQVGCADLIVVSKSDLVEEDALRSVESRVKEEARPAVRLVRAANGDLPLDVIIGLDAAAEDDGRQSHHDIHHADDEDHDHDEFTSFVATLGQIKESDTLKERIAALMQEHDILRLKGFADVEGRDMRLVVQAVGPRVESYFDRPWEDGEPRQTRLVVIGEAGLDHTAIERALGTIC